MATNINQFKREWHIRWAQGVEPVLQPSWQLVLGTGQYGACEPFLSPEGEVCIGFAIREPTQDGWITYSSSDEWGPLVLHDGQLRWEGQDKDGQPLRMYISVAEAVAPAGPYVSIYGSTLRGDPDQVAVWGANDSPPPPPLRLR